MMLLKPYLQLVRISGIFTVFTNILLGFFVTQGTDIDWTSLGPLLVTSSLLFLAGMSLNDFFDYKIDVRDRPTRPLPSGKIQKKYALYIGFSFLITANIISAFIGLQAIIVTIIITVLIIIYDIKSKNIPIIGILNMSAIRFTNVILGGTVIIFNQELFVIAVPIGILVSAISIFAKKESTNYSTNTEIINLGLIIITIISVIIITFDSNFIHYAFVVLFGTSVFIPLYIFRKKTPEFTQKKITYQLLSITILDSAIISAFSDVVFAIIVAALYIPAYFITKQLYLT